MSLTNGSLIEFTPDAIEDERLATNLAGFELPHPITHAGGIGHNLDQVKELARTVVPIIMFGSFYEVPPSIGDKVTGLGPQYVGEHILEMANIAHEAHKPLAVSVAGFDPEGHGQAAEYVAGYADIIEINLGFPCRDWDEQAQRFTAPLDLGDLAEIVADVKQRVSDTPVGVKLPHITESESLDEVVAAIRELPIAYVAAVGLNQVAELRKLLPDPVQLVGVEKKDEDVLDYLKVDASASVVQVAGSYWASDRRQDVFGSIMSRYWQQLLASEIAPLRRQSQ